MRTSSTDIIYDLKNAKSGFISSIGAELQADSYTNLDLATLYFDMEKIINMIPQFHFSSYKTENNNHKLSHFFHFEMCS